jgi:hypothetical protein
MHDLQSDLEASGTARVTRGTGIVARLVAYAVGLPRTADTTPVTVRFSVAAGVESWARAFGEHRFSSAQFAGQGRSEHLVCERFGALTFAMGLVVNGGRLSLVPRRWSAWGIPLPLWLGPRVDAHERVENGRFCFRVDIRHAFTGLIVRYEGSLASPGQAKVRNAAAGTA